MQKLTLTIALVLAIFASFQPLHRSELTWDSQTLAHLNSEPKLAQALLRTWTVEKNTPYKPLPPSLLLLGRTFVPEHKLTAQHLHGVNIAVHSAAAVMVFLILALCVQNLPASFVGAMIFALHPLQLETLARSDMLGWLLSCFLGLAAVLIYLHHESRSDYRRRQQSRSSIYLASALFLAAMLCHPIAYVMPLVAYLLQRLLPRPDSILRARRPVWPMLLWAGLGAPLALHALLAIFATAPERGGFWLIPILAGDALSFYISKIFVPLFIGPDYGRSPQVVLAQWWGYFTWIFPAALLICVLYIRGRRGLWYTTAALISLVGVSPFLGLLPLEELASSTVADRYLYLALIGPALALSYAVSMAKRSWLPILALALLVAAAVLTRREGRHWLTDHDLWTHALQINPDSPLANTRLGDRARFEGDHAKARELYNKVLAVNANDPDILFFVAGLEYQDGNSKLATELYEKVLKLNPRHVPSLIALGYAKLSQGDNAAAKACFEQALGEDPDNFVARYRLGVIAAQAGAPKDTILHLKAALASPELSQLKTTELADLEALLGQALVHEGSLDEGRIHLEQALKHAPDHHEAHRALGDLEFAAGRESEALPHYEKAILAPNIDKQTLTRLGLARMARKQYDLAAEAFERVVKIDPEANDARLQLGIVYFRLRRLTEAAALFNRVLKLNPDIADAHYYLGDIARWQAKETESLAAYYRALKINPQHADANFRLGNYFLQKNQHEQAKRHFQAALQGAPDDPRLKYGLLKAEQAAGGTAVF